MAFFLFAGIATAQPAIKKGNIPSASVHDSALPLLKRSLNFLAKQQQFSFTAELGFDSVQEDGQKIEFGSKRTLIIHRPQRIRMESYERNGQKLEVIYDGRNISFFSARENKFAIKSYTGTLDDFLNHLANDLDVPIPLAQVGYSNFTETIMEQFDTGFVVGESTIAGYLCDHLTFRNEEIDFQVWVRKSGEPLPVRWIITYKNQAGQPQFRAQFTEWNLNLRIEDSMFTFTPPKGAEQIVFASEQSGPPQEILELLNEAEHQ